MVHEESQLDPCYVERSIVSIRVRRAEAAAPGGGNENGNGGWLDMGELRDLYRWMSMDVSDLVPEAGSEERRDLSRPAYIGQPVDVSEEHGIVRIALGVESLLSYLDDREATLEEDRATVRKLAAIARHFGTLKRSGF
jgi:hypothetical protein